MGSCFRCLRTSESPLYKGNPRIRVKGEGNFLNRPRACARARDLPRHLPTDARMCANRCFIACQSMLECEKTLTVFRKTLTVLAKTLTVFRPLMAQHIAFEPPLPSIPVVKRANLYIFLIIKSIFSNKIRTFADASAHAFGLMGGTTTY